MNVKGRRVRRSTETTDKRLAEKIHAKVLTEITEGRWFEKMPGEQKTFREMMEKYLDEYSANHKAPTSHRRDKSLAKHLNTFFGELILTEIGPKFVYKYKVKRRGERASARTICYELALMSHAYNLAIKEWEWLKDNPVRMVSKDRINNHMERWLTVAEEELLLSVSPGWLRQIVTFAVNTGLRQGEILGLKWPQVDLRRKTVTIFEQKNRSVDTLPLNEGAFNVLRERSKVRHIMTNLVFYSGKGTPIDSGNLRRAFYSAVKKAEIEKLRFHDLRHTFATRLVQAGVDIYTVQRLGRWKTVQMVMRYGHHYPESLRAGVKVLDGIKDEPCEIVSQFGHNLAK